MVVLPFEFKTKDASLSSSPSPSSAKKSRTRAEKEVNHSEESDDNEEKPRIVVKRTANAFCVEADSCVSRKPKLSGAMDPGNPAK